MLTAQEILAQGVVKLELLILDPADKTLPPPLGADPESDPTTMEQLWNCKT